MISVLTCTYNREEYLPALYKSLAGQTSYNFEWVIVDDGSTDHTQMLADAWMHQEKRFTISYYWQHNGGKHRAINEGMKHVSGDWVFLVDSDDELTKDAIETAGQWIAELEKEPGADRFAAVAGVRMTRKGKILGGFPKLKNKERYIDAKNNERQRRHIRGDKAEIYRADLMRMYPFPAFKNENFLSEGAVWNRIALDGFKVRWYPHAIYVCDYLEGGLTRNDNKWIENFNGFTYMTKISIAAFRGIYRIRPIIKYIHYAKMKGMTGREIIAKLNISVYEYVAGMCVNVLYSAVKENRN